VADLITLQTEFEPGVDERTKGLRQHHRQATVHQVRDLLGRAAEAAVRPAIRWGEWHQRVQAQHQVQPHVEQHARVQRLLQRAVHIPATVDRHRRKQARQCGAGRHRL
jgi:hypothetical protein